MGVIIAVVNNKGGVGKSVVSTNIASALGSNTRSVLLVDMDAQCDSTDNFNLSSVEEKNTLCGMIKSSLDTGNANIKEYIHSTEDRGVYVIPNHVESAWLETELYKNIPDNFYIFRKIIRDYAKLNYSYTILDTPPNMGIFVTMAMIASDFVIVPVEGGSLRAVKGLNRAISTINEIKESANSDLKFLRLLLNRVDMRTSISKAVADHLINKFGKSMMFDTVIPQNTIVQQSEAARVSLMKIGPSCKSAQRFRSLAKEIMKMTEGE
jgi:cellulose biosynthesis protein BcsQ